MNGGRVVTSRAQGTDEQLALAAQAGDTRAADELVRRYRDLAYFIARPYGTLLSDPDDMRQEALIGVLTAVRTYRVDGGASFRGIATLAIRRRLFTVITTDNRMRRRSDRAPVSLQAWATDDEDVTVEGSIADPRALDPSETITHRRQIARLVAAAATLSVLEREALAGWLNGETRFETSERLGRRLSAAVDKSGKHRPSSIDNARARALAKLHAALDLEEPRPLGVAA